MELLTEKQLERLPEWMLEIHQEITLRSCMFTRLSKPSENQMRLLHELAHALEKVEAGKLMAAALDDLAAISTTVHGESFAVVNAKEALKAWNEVSND